MESSSELSRARGRLLSLDVDGEADSALDNDANRLSARSWNCKRMERMESQNQDWFR